MHIILLCNMWLFKRARCAVSTTSRNVTYLRSVEMSHAYIHQLLDTFCSWVPRKLPFSVLLQEYPKNITVYRMPCGCCCCITPETPLLDRALCRVYFRNFKKMWFFTGQYLPAMRVELIRPFSQRILSPQCLPFHHAGKRTPSRRVSEKM